MSLGRILIVDDDAPIRQLLRTIAEDGGFTVVGEAADGAEAVELAAALRPDLITMDLDMPVLNGAEATKVVCERGDCRAIVIVSGSESSDLLAAAVAAGARWRVAKRDAQRELPQILRTLAGTRC